jgi:DNA adenine methylase
MKYVGSKASIAKQLVAVIEANSNPLAYKVECFSGGANFTQHWHPNVAIDVNPFIQIFFEGLTAGWFEPRWISKGDYMHYKKLASFTKPDHRNRDLCAMIGWAGAGCSYSGKWFGGYAGKVNTKEGVRDYMDESIRNVLAQRDQLGQLTYFRTDSYETIAMYSNCTIYCDPPYAGTTGYGDFGIDHVNFWDIVRMSSKNNVVFVSEYNAPDDFACIWESDKSSSLSANGKSGGSKRSTEKMFVHRSLLS